jgi:endonuclease/exonuclease/phosphatase family metal-dependent hydrolase
MTYNLYGGNYATAEAIGAFLATQDLDLVGLQECPADYLAPIAAAAGFEHMGGAGVALLSRTPLIGLETVALRSGRSFVHATTEIAGVAFSVYVAHLGWNLDGDRQCREFVDEHLAADPLPHLLLVGDFNDEHLSSQIAILEELVADAATAAGCYPGQRISWPATRFDDTEGSQLIDLIFFRRTRAPNRGRPAGST